MQTADIAQVAEWVLAADHIAVLTGAGISTASGIPDFRSAAGIYATRASENVFDIELFRRDPAPFYKFAAWFYPVIAHAQPNAAHNVLADWERGGKQIEIATQNVDDLHQRAGSQRVYPVHGSWRTSRCLNCSKDWKSVHGFERQLVQRGPHQTSEGITSEEEITDEERPVPRRSPCVLPLQQHEPDHYKTPSQRHPGEPVPTEHPDASQPGGCITQTPSKTQVEQGP